MQPKILQLLRLVSVLLLKVFPEGEDVGGCAGLLLQNFVLELQSRALQLEDELLKLLPLLLLTTGAIMKLVVES